MRDWIILNWREENETMWEEDKEQWVPQPTSVSAFMEGENEMNTVREKYTSIFSAQSASSFRQACIYL